MIKKIKYLSLIIITILLNINFVLANENNHIIDFNKKGSIKINIQEDNKPIEGIEITIYKIATATSKNNSLSFIYDEDILNCNIDLSNISDQSLINKIDKCITNLELPNQIKITNETGNISFNNLELGLYLVKQTNKIKNYSNIDSFLIAIPKEINNAWIYDIDSTPKIDIIRLIDITVEKRWDIVNSENTPKEVTINLLKNDEVIDTVILNKENNWTYTWYQIEKSEEYSVKEINIPAGYTETYRQIDNKFIVTNTKALIQTGQNIILIKLSGVLGLIFIITGIILKKRKNYE